MKNMLLKLKPARVVRWALLSASTIFFLFFSRFVSEHAICPIGGFEIFFTNLFRSGFSIAGLFSGMVVLFLVMSALSVLFRRAYCGYLCPLGALQEGFERLGAAVLPEKLRKLRLPRRADRTLRWVKYGVLAFFVVGAALIGGHWMLPADPFIVMMSLFGGRGLAGTWARLPTAVVFFFAVLAAAFFFGRVFCKYLCPAGAWYGLLSKISPNKIVRDEEKCISCGRCSAACPMDIDVAHTTRVTSAECIGCKECVNACPAKGALSAPVGSIEVSPTLVPVIAAAAFVGGAYLSAASMPARGEGGRGPRAENGENRVYTNEQRGTDTGTVKKVGLGGCAGCVGCGLCKVATIPPAQDRGV